MTPSPLDPTWLLKLAQALLGELFKADAKRLNRSSLELVSENRRLGGPRDGFYFAGRLFSDLDPKLRARGEKGNLVQALAPRAQEYIRDEASVQFDKVRCQQALVVVLKPCKCRQDVFDALPNALHDALRSVSSSYIGLSRTRPEAWSIETNAQALSQYQKLRDRLEFYNIAKLLY